MCKMKPNKPLLAIYAASVMTLVLVLHPTESESERTDGVAMVTGRLLNVPGQIVGQPVPMTENMAAIATVYSTA